MSDETKEKAMERGKDVVKVGLGGAVVAVLITFGLIGPNRDVQLQQTENRLTKIEERQVALETLIDVRLRSIEQTMQEVKAEIRRGNN